MYPPFLPCNNPINHKLALENMLEGKIKRGYESKDTIIHNDQGTIYSSIIDLVMHCNIKPQVSIELKLGFQ